MSENSVFDLTDDDDDEATGEHESAPPSDREPDDGEELPNEDLPDDEEALEDGSRSIRLLVGEILAIPSDNVSRGGHMLPPNHPDVQSLAQSIASEGLLHHVGVRPLPEPIERPQAAIEADRVRFHGSDQSVATHYTHRMVYGFERLVAIRDVLGWYTIPCVSKPRTDNEAFSACLAENVGRRDPTEYDLAMGFALLVSSLQPRPTWDQVARITGCRPSRARTLVTIAERCPAELLEVFRVSPTAETRRKLEAVAVSIDPENREREEVRHKMMLEEWERMNAPLPANSANASKGNGAPPGRKAITIGRVRPIDVVKLAHLRDTLAGASEWLDPVAGWQPMSQETRAALDALLRHTLDPRGNAKPVR